MKAFLLAVVACVIIAVGVAYLGPLVNPGDPSSRTASSVRLD
jgi:hypothetical protein